MDRLNGASGEVMIRRAATTPKVLWSDGGVRSSGQSVPLVLFASPPCSQLWLVATRSVDSNRPVRLLIALRPLLG